MSSIWKKCAMLAVAAVVMSGADRAKATESGDLFAFQGSYQYLDRDEPLVATDRKLDLWAQVYFPSVLDKPAPLIILLHGNHATCGRFDEELGVRVDDRSDYTRTGKCPEGYEVVPNHLGYNATANNLASWGYVVVSINANRGINAGAGIDGDRGLNLMRGRLILRHLAMLSDWNQGKGDIPAPESLGFDPKGKIDFSQVGFIGHSRGGEGARAALQIFRDKGNPFKDLIGRMNVRSIFEVGPVDGQTGRVLNAYDVNSMVILPSCDGDVFNLEGVGVFDRVFSAPEGVDKKKVFHGSIEVRGTNHNGYNSEWMVSDSYGCAGALALFPKAGQSYAQQDIMALLTGRFFRATVGSNADLSLTSVFDPAVPLPKDFSQITTYNRGYLPSPIGDKTIILEDWASKKGLSKAGLENDSDGILVGYSRAGAEGHDPSVRTVAISWTQFASRPRYYQLNMSEEGLDLSKYKTLAFRLSPHCFERICKTNVQKSILSFDVALVGADGRLSTPISTRSQKIYRPLGETGGEPNTILHTLEASFADFGDIDLTKVAGIRFIFEDQSAASLRIGAVTASTIAISGAGQTEIASAADAAPVADKPAPRPSSTAGADGNRMKVVRAASGAGVRAAAAAAPASSDVSIVLSSKRFFPVTGSLPKLKVGARTIEGGDVASDGKSIVFKVSEKEFAALADGAEVSLDIVKSSAVWKFGSLKK